MGQGGYGDAVAAPKVYRVYPRRWAVLAAVFLLNMSNGALWITYAPVSTIAAAFYDTTPYVINYFSMSYLIASFPLSFLCTYLMKRVGLGKIVHVGAVFNTAGAVVKTVGTMGFMPSPTSALVVSFIGQILAAIAQSFLFYLGTKVSQTWFAERERMFVTTAIAMADPVGAVVAQMLTPYIVLEQADMVTNNYIWMGLALLAQAVTLVGMTSSKPPTPPTASSEKSEDEEGEPWLAQLKAVFTNKAYLILFVCIGFSIGIYAAISTVTQQMLCGLGYSTQFSGYASSFPQLFGFIGSGVLSWYVSRTKRFILTCKVVYAVGAVAAILMAEFYLQADQQVGILIFCAIFGFFGVGGFPVGLELGVEATYPVEEMISSAFILMCGQIQGIVLINIIGALATDPKPEYAAVQTCNSDPALDIRAQDYTWSMVALMAISTVINLVLILFFDTPYKRTLADRADPKPEVEESRP